MDCKKFQEMIANDWPDSLDARSRGEFERHLAECNVCRDEFESLNNLWTGLGQIPLEDPRPSMQQRFYAMLDGYCRAIEKPEVRSTERPRFVWWRSLWLRPAFQSGMAVLLVLLGFAGGYCIHSNNGGHGNGGHEEIESLRAEVHETRQMLAVSLLNQSSASERLKGTSWSTQVSSPDPEFLAALSNTLNNDPNVNVRLAAMDALAHFVHYPAVRHDLVKSLPLQDSPLVQIMLIDLLVQLQERQSIGVLRQVVDDSSQNPQVRDRAQWGLQKLL